jgi:hypothetical protein
MNNRRKGKSPPSGKMDAISYPLEEMGQRANETPDTTPIQKAKEGLGRFHNLQKEHGLGTGVAGLRG